MAEGNNDDVMGRHRSFEMTTSKKFQLPSRLFGSNTSSKLLLLDCVDCHCGGEPARVVLDGMPHVDGLSAYDKRRYMMDNLDWIRQTLLLEPRGYPCQNVNFIFYPDTDDNDIVRRCHEDAEQQQQQEQQEKQHGNSSTIRMIQYVIGEQGKIYPAMSGHNTVCVATALLECNVVEMVEPITDFTLESPAGPIAIRATCSHGKATSITFRNEPSFVEMLGVKVHVPTLPQPVIVDIAYGGMWYGVVNAQSIGLELQPENGKRICRIGEMIKVATREQYPVQHPIIDYPGIDILVFCDGDEPKEIANDDDCYGDTNSSLTTFPTLFNRNVVVMSNSTTYDWNNLDTFTAMIDRSPCGTGTCAVMAVLHAKGKLHIGQRFIHESIVGSQFVGKLIEESTTIIPNKHSVIPEITGSAYITQYSKIVVDPTDPFPTGYRVNDIW